MIKSKIIGKTKEEVNAHIKSVYENINEAKQDFADLLKEGVSAQNVFEQQIENQKKLLK